MPVDEGPGRSIVERYVNRTTLVQCESLGGTFGITAALGGIAFPLNYPLGCYIRGIALPLAGNENITANNLVNAWVGFYKAHATTRYVPGDRLLNQLGQPLFEEFTIFQAGGGAKNTDVYKDEAAPRFSADDGEVDYLEFRFAQQSGKVHPGDYWAFLEIDPTNITGAAGRSFRSARAKNGTCCDFLATGAAYNTNLAIADASAMPGLAQIATGTVAQATLEAHIILGIVYED